jgi:hypothetical protein
MLVLVLEHQADGPLPQLWWVPARSCHGPNLSRVGASRNPGTVHDRTARDAFIDYAYVLEADRLQVLTNRPGGWQPVAETAWTEQPDWDAIDQHAQHLRRGW